MSMDSEINEFNELLAGLKAQKKMLMSSLSDLEKDKEKEKKNHGNLITAGKYIREVAEATQDKIKFHISEFVTAGIQSIISDDSEFVVEFDTKRNQVECQMWLRNGEDLVSPFGADGGGACDVIATLLRLSMWAINKSRPVILLDEPFKFLHSVEYQERCSAMINGISRELGVQFIIISAQPDIVSNADAIFEVKKGRVEKIK